jgi:hypothetical protein
MASASLADTSRIVASSDAVLMARSSVRTSVASIKRACGSSRCSVWKASAGKKGSSTPMVARSATSPRMAAAARALSPLVVPAPVRRLAIQKGRAARARSSPRLPT